VRPARSYGSRESLAAQSPKERACKSSTGGSVIRTTTFILTVVLAVATQTLSPVSAQPRPVTPRTSRQAAFDISLSDEGDKSVNAGYSVVNTIRASFVSGISQQISFSVAGIPSGTLTSFSQPKCNVSCSSALTISTTTGTSAGTFPITVTARRGRITKSTVFNLEVVGPLANSTQQTVSTDVSANTGSSTPTNTLPIPASTPSIQQGPSTASLVAFKTLLPITIDGNLNESVWSRANFVTFSNPLRSDNIVKVSVLWDDENLYFGYDVTDNQVEATVRDLTAEGCLGGPIGCRIDIDNLFLDDGAEIYIDTQNSKSTSVDADDYLFLANINGATNVSRVQAKAVLRWCEGCMGPFPISLGYTMEIKLPWSALSTVPTAGKILGMLLANNDRDFGIPSQFDWLGLINTGAYTRPYLWGDLTLGSTTVGP
jgi:hypothetical protein